MYYHSSYGLIDYGELSYVMGTLLIKVKVNFVITNLFPISPTQLTHFLFFKFRNGLVYFRKLVSR